MGKKGKKADIRAEDILLSSLYEIRKMWYRSNERKEQMYERKFNELVQWVERVEIYLLLCRGQK